MNSLRSPGQGASPEITFLAQGDPPDEYGRALFAVARSLVRALLDQLGSEDLEDLQSNRDEVTLRQLAKISRLDRDKGMRGDGFEWAVHEAIAGGEPRVSELVSTGLSRATKSITKDSLPTSLMFGYERAKHLGFLDAVVQEAGNDARLLPGRKQGRPFAFGPWVRVAAGGSVAEGSLSPRIQKIWKTDLFLSDSEGLRYLAASVKSQHAQLEGGAGLRLGIVPESSRVKGGVRYDSRHGLWVVSLPDPDGFMGLFNDAYAAVAEALYSLGKHTQSKYWLKPSAKAQRLTDQLIKNGRASVLEIEDALNEAAQQDLVKVEHRLVPVGAPDWLHLGMAAPRVIAPKPSFEGID